ncbi:MAG: class I SAM-dependent methyltransferase [Bacteroidales bacterium]|nr:class I SAM-dependent methyltransferase [Bacteroidales bacterium]
MFDEVAIRYDETFTHTQIGTMQRNFVWNYLNRVLPENEMMTILELNCGTGEDAIFLAQKGHKITATDISSEMISVVKNKIAEKDLRKDIQTLQCDIRNVGDCFPEDTFNLVFSNFGGLNCLNSADLIELSGTLAKILKSGGRFIAVVMTNFCLWESLYFIAKLKFKEVFRRNTKNGMMVKVGKHEIETWYYAPGEFGQLFESNFRTLGSVPIGFAVPPSYLEPFFKTRLSFLNKLNRIDGLIQRITAMARMSDHFLIDFLKI